MTVGGEDFFTSIFHTREGGGLSRIFSWRTMTGEGSEAQKCHFFYDVIIGRSLSMLRWIAVNCNLSQDFKYDTDFWVPKTSPESPKTFLESSWVVLQNLKFLSKNMFFFPIFVTLCTTLPLQNGTFGPFGKSRKKAIFRYFCSFQLF